MAWYLVKHRENFTTIFIVISCACNFKPHINFDRNHSPIDIPMCLTSGNTNRNIYRYKQRYFPQDSLSLLWFCLALNQLSNILKYKLKIIDKGPI